MHCCISIQRPRQVSNHRIHSTPQACGYTCAPTAVVHHPQRTTINRPKTNQQHTNNTPTTTTNNNKTRERQRNSPPCRTLAAALAPRLISATTHKCAKPCPCRPPAAPSARRAEVRPQPAASGHPGRRRRRPISGMARNWTRYARIARADIFLAGRVKDPIHANSMRGPISGMVHRNRIRYIQVARVDLF